MLLGSLLKILIPEYKTEWINEFCTIERPDNHYSLTCWRLKCALLDNGVHTISLLMSSLSSVVHFLDFAFGHSVQSKKKRLICRECPRVCGLVSVTKLLVRFSWHSTWEFFTKCYQASMSWLKLGLMSLILFLGV